MSKICSKCGICKERIEYSFDKRAIDGLQSRCKLCSKMAQRIYVDKNRERVNKFKKCFYVKNKEKIRNSQSKYRLENREKINLVNASWGKANPERVKLANIKWRRNNVEKVKESRNKWRVYNPEKSRLILANYRAAKFKATPSWADNELMELVYAEATHRGLEVDHIIPLQNDIVCGLHVYWNTQLLSRRENAIKSNRVLA